MIQMKKLNKRGSTTMALILFVAAMAVSMQFLALGTTQNQTIARHAEQIENVYNYGSLAEMIADAVDLSFDDYQVRAPRDVLSGINSYLTMSEELRGKFIVGVDEYSLFTPTELIQNASPSGGEAGKFIKKLIESPTLKMSVTVSNLFVPDINAEGNVLNFTSGDKIYFEPYIIEVTVSDVATTVIKSWEVRGVYADIAINSSEVILKPNFSAEVMKPRESLYS